MVYTMDPVEDSKRKNDVVYFSGDTSSASWAGTIAKEHDMGDEEVNKYVADQNPQLYAKLREMRHGSSDVPMSFKPMHDLRRLDDVDQKSRNTATAAPKTLAPPNAGNFFAASRSANEKHLRDLLRKVKSSCKTGEAKNNHYHDQILVQDQLKLDGIPREAIVNAALRLYPKITPAQPKPYSCKDNHLEQDNAYLYPTNSKQALELRALQQLEINESLAEINKYERAMRAKATKPMATRYDTRESSPDFSVLITKPAYMESREYRYKKQGLTEHDGRKDRKEKAGIITDLPAAYQPVQFRNQLPPLKVYYCYCREEEDGREMIRCSKQWCPVGWFHLSCTGLERTPYLNEEFHCAYCSDDNGHLITEAALDAALDGRPKTDVAGYLANAIAQHYLDNEIETEVEFMEEDFSERGTNVFAQPSIYDDEAVEDYEQYEEDDEAEAWAKAAHARLRDRVVKWQAVNDPHQHNKDNATCLPARKPESEYSFASSYDVSSEGDNVDQVVGNKSEALVSEASTIQARCPIAPCYGNEFNVSDRGIENAVFNRVHAVNAAPNNDISSASGHSSGNTLSIIQYKPTYTYKYKALKTPSANSLANSKPSYTPQPATITDTTARTHVAHSRSTLSSARSGLPSHLSSFHAHDRAAGPQTPMLAPRVGGTIPSLSSKPWGTPVNLKDYQAKHKHRLGNIYQPTSPSPAAKRKFSEMSGRVENGDNEVYEQGEEVMMDNEVEDMVEDDMEGYEDYEEEESDDEEEE